MIPAQTGRQHCKLPCWQMDCRCDLWSRQAPLTGTSTTRLIRDVRCGARGNGLLADDNEGKRHGDCLMGWTYFVHRHQLIMWSSLPLISNPFLSRSGYIGAASCMILANFGSAWGTWKAGLGVCKMGIDYPKGVIKNIVPIVMAGVLGI